MELGGIERTDEELRLYARDQMNQALIALGRDDISTAAAVLADLAIDMRRWATEKGK